MKIVLVMRLWCVFVQLAFHVMGWFNHMFAFVCQRMHDLFRNDESVTDDAGATMNDDWRNVYMEIVGSVWSFGRFGLPEARLANDASAKNSYASVSYTKLMRTSKL